MLYEYYAETMKYRCSTSKYGAGGRELKIHKQLET